MKTNRIVLFAALSTTLATSPVFSAPPSAKPTPAEQQIIDYMEAGEPTILRLWPADSPRNKSRNGKPEVGNLSDKLRLTNTEKPSLLIFQPPEQSTRLDSAILFAPGGGYKNVVLQVPQQVTEWFHHLGITVAVLKYHVPRVPEDPKHLGPLADAQRAFRLLRHHAKDLGLDPDKIGMAGASAGGHLAFNTCLHRNDAVYDAIDDIDKEVIHPAYGFLFYPAYLGSGKGVEMHRNLELDQLGEDTPPMFMTINGDDRSFVIGNLAAMVALDDKEVPGELHIYTRGGHAGSFNKYPFAEFARPGARFLVRHGAMPESLLDRSDVWLDQTVAKLHTPPTPTAVAAATGAPDGLPVSQLTLIDRTIREATGKEHSVYRLWPGDGTREDDPLKDAEETLKPRKVPVATGVTAPTMTFFPAAKPTGRGVLVFPGGGYGVLAWEHEGAKVAEWLNDQGVHAFLVKYRTPRRTNLPKHHVALQDAHRAMRLVRSQAKAFGVATNQIGVLGFSAGGHLAALTGTTLEAPSYEPIDGHDKVSPVADFSILIYPAYTTTAMDGNEVDPLLLQTAPTGPTFVATAADDKYTRGQYFYLHTRLRAKTPLAYHVYETGGHGKGILDTPTAFSQWPRDCARWLQDLTLP